MKENEKEIRPASAAAEETRKPWVKPEMTELGHEMTESSAPGGYSPG